MKKYFPSKLANVLLHVIKDNDVKDVTRRCAEDMYSVMRDHEGADFKAAFQIADANRKKDAEQEEIARRVGDLESTANYWARVCDERNDRIKTMYAEIEMHKRTIAQFNEHIKSEDVTTGITSVMIGRIEDMNVEDIIKREG